MLGLGDWSLIASREKDKFVDVSKQSVFVELQRFLVSIFSSVIDRDSDGSGELNSKTGSLDFSKGESSTKSGSVIISDGLASDGRSEGFDGSGGK